MEIIDDLYGDTLQVIPPTETADFQGGVSRTVVPVLAQPAAAPGLTTPAGSLPAGTYGVVYTLAPTLGQGLESPPSPPTYVVVANTQQIQVAALGGLPGAAATVRYFLVESPTGLVGFIGSQVVAAGTVPALNITSANGNPLILPPLQVPGRVEDLRIARGTTRYIREQGDVGEITHVAFCPSALYNPDGTLLRLVVIAVDYHLRDQNGSDYLVQGVGSRKAKNRFGIQDHFEVDLKEIAGGI